MTQLFSPKKIGAVEIPNRIVMPAMTTRLAEPDGSVSEATIAYFGARATGGVGLVTVEMASPERAGRHRLRELGICEDRYVPGLRRLTDALHARGAKASIQLGHAGGHTREDICGEAPIAPSAIPHYVFEVTGATITPLEMNHTRIATTIEAFVAAAVRARAAGFDCVELHVAHGYLLSQFLCPAENRRQDEYGGSLENRARLSLEILKRIKCELPDFPVIFRFNADDLFPGGLRFEESLQVAKWAADAGTDALHVTAGHYRSLPSAHMMTPPMNCAEGIFLDYAAQVKRAVSVPVIAVGRLGDPQLAMAAVDTGKADFVALGRSLIADPEWAIKAMRNVPVRRCLACNSCVDEMRGGDRLHCVVNPAAARELECSGTPGIPGGERIAVIGAGPAGLTYAEQVAGANRVTVFEREARSGGALRYAGLAPLFQGVAAEQRSLDRFVDELERACRAKGVEFRFGSPVRALAAIARDFDRVVLATGAEYRLGAGALVRSLLRAGWGRSALAQRLFQSTRVRHWLYHDARSSVMPGLGQAGGAKVVVIGDAKSPGKTRDAIASAFEAARRR
jgi:2,4-dienoyl-CoA reductase-like NADH-dependent reductase (Old Yellow Enzyme family)